MAAAGKGAAAQWSSERSVAGGRSPWLIIGVISIATFMMVLDTSIANVALGHIAGSLSASTDEASWVITSFLISNAIIIPISGWLADVIGRKRYYMMSVGLFTVSSLLCGLAPNLTLLIAARVLQGIGGGGLAPTEQSMLVDTFPPEKRGLAFAAYGIVVIVGPIAGPTLGGLLTDNWSWHWVFLINVPVGLLSLSLVGLFVNEPEAVVRQKREMLKGGLKFDFIGFGLIALCLGSLEFTLDRGQHDDWFSSPTITVFAVLAGLAFAAFIPWELTRDDPIVNIRMFRQRNFAITSVLLLITGLIVFGTTLFIPQLLQQVLGYTATEAGLALTAGGLATVVMMPIAGVLTNRVDARYMVGVAFVIQALALWHMSHLSTGISFNDAALARMFQAVGLPFLFVPISIVAYVGLKPEENNQASALMNVARNLGGTVGIAAVQTLLAQRQQFHQARYVETLNPLNPAYTAGMDRISQALVSHGLSAADANRGAAVELYRSLLQQSLMLSYVEAFHLMMIAVLCTLPLVFLMRRPQKGAPGPAAA